MITFSRHHTGEGGEIERPHFKSQVLEFIFNSCILLFFQGFSFFSPIFSFSFYHHADGRSPFLLNQAITVLLSLCDLSQFKTLTGSCKVVKMQPISKSLEIFIIFNICKNIPGDILSVSSFLVFHADPLEYSLWWFDRVT